MNRLYVFRECEVIALASPVDPDSFPHGPKAWGVTDEASRNQATREYWERGWHARPHPTSPPLAPWTPDKWRRAHTCCASALAQVLD
eukprot:3880829-Prymnesium_polylepis.1